MRVREERRFEIEETHGHAIKHGQTHHRTNEPITPTPHTESNTIEHGQIHKSNYHKVQTHITTNKNPHTIPKLNKPQITKPRIWSHFTNHKISNLNPRIWSHLTNHKIGNPNPRIRSHLNTNVHNPISHRLEPKSRGESWGEKKRKEIKEKICVWEWEVSLWGIK